MELLDQARAVLLRHYGYPDFRGGQIPAIECVLSGRDALILMPTGGGKSLCYQIPSQVLPGITIVVSPLISLMKDQVDSLNRRGIAATFVNSTLKPVEMTARFESVRTGQVKLLYVAPERFESPSFKQQLAQLQVSLLAVDEAHCVSQWGRDFRPSYARLNHLGRELKCPVLALTATATPEVRADIIRMLALRKPKVVAFGFDRPNLSWAVQSVADDIEKDREFVRRLRPGQHDGVSIAYAATRKRVQMLSDLLNTIGIRSVAYHAGLSPADRQRLQEEFIAGTSGVVVATNAFGMGIDKPDVRLVVHYDYPGSPEAYYQEAGRGGRDGRPAHCLILCGPEDYRTHEFLLEQAHPKQKLVAGVWRALNEMAAARNTALSADAVAKASGHSCNARQAEAALATLKRLRCINVSARTAGPPRLRLVVTLARVLSIARVRAPLAAQAIAMLEQRHANGALYSGISLDRKQLGRAGDRESLERELAVLAADRLIEWEPFRSASSFQLIRAPTETDWKELAQHRHRETRRLESMRGYTACKSCRRAFLLRYFGEEPAGSDCSGCDNCDSIKSRRTSWLAGRLFSR